MTCELFYQSVYEQGCAGIGETCEKCMLIPILNPLILLTCSIGLILIILSIIIHNRGGK